MKYTVPYVVNHAVLMVFCGAWFVFGLIKCGELVVGYIMIVLLVLQLVPVTIVAVINTWRSLKDLLSGCCKKETDHIERESKRDKVIKGKGKNKKANTTREGNRK